MSEHIVLLKIAKDEIKTIIEYSEMLEASDGDGAIAPIVDEIMGDEFNHALISLLSAANLMGIKIATDDITPDPNNIEVTDAPISTEV